jgi:serine/threonine protein kinase
MLINNTDLKLENILFQDSANMQYLMVNWNNKRKEILLPISMKIKIIDFGGATFSDEHKSTIVNTRQYRGPEVRK